MMGLLASSRSAAWCHVSGHVLHWGRVVAYMSWSRERALASTAHAGMQVTFKAASKDREVHQTIVLGARHLPHAPGKHQVLLLWDSGLHAAAHHGLLTQP